MLRTPSIVLIVGLTLVATAAGQGQPAPRNAYPPHWSGEGVNQAAYAAPLPATSSPHAVPHVLPAAPLPRTKDAARPLLPRGQATPGEAGATNSGAMLTTLGSLAIVLCLFFAVAWVLRRGAPGTMAVLPGEVVELLGRAPLPGRHQMHLVRCGHKLLLVAVSTAGADTLTEITDPLEVDRLCGLCRQNHPHSATSTFRNLLQQFGRDSQPESSEDDDA